MSHYIKKIYFNLRGCDHKIHIKRRGGVVCVWGKICIFFQHWPPQSFEVNSPISKVFQTMLTWLFHVLHHLQVETSNQWLLVDWLITKPCMLYLTLSHVFLLSFLQMMEIPAFASIDLKLLCIFITGQVISEWY